jgi:Molybdopterin-binding domain of aldehyde dehydrogenase
MLVDEQIRGGVIQGLGAAFFEECVYGENGQLTIGSLADYLVPMAVEMPDIEIGHVATPAMDTRLGAKGVAKPARLRRRRPLFWCETGAVARTISRATSMSRVTVEQDLQRGSAHFNL